MIELRYKVEQWTEMTEFGHEIDHSEESILQYRERMNPDETGLQNLNWSEWTDVPTEYVEV